MRVFSLILAFAVLSCKSDKPPQPAPAPITSKQPITADAAVASVSVPVPLSANQMIALLATKRTRPTDQFLLEEWSARRLRLVLLRADGPIGDAKSAAMMLLKFEINTLIELKYNPRIAQASVSIGVVQERKTVTDDVKHDGIGDAVYDPAKDEIVWEPVTR